MIKDMNSSEEDLKTCLSTEQNKNKFKESLEKIPLKYPILNSEKINFYLTKQPTSAGIIKLKIDCFVVLTELGVEMYSLLKDEIENYPTDYLEAILNDDQYKNFGLAYEILT